MGSVYFVSGIDTGIGKSVMTGLMARSLLRRGVDAITVKMVQTGNDGFSEDIELHRRICESEPLPEDVEGLTAPQIFKFPSSPLLAASMEGRSVNLGRIAESVNICAARHEVVLVESAGGLCVPLTDDTLSVDFAAAQGWPLILVTCGRLGSINHTLLSLEAAKRRGVRIAGVVHNWCANVDPRIDADAEATVRRALRAMDCPPVVIRVGQVAAPWPDLDFSMLVGR